MNKISNLVAHVKSRIIAQIKYNMILFLENEICNCEKILDLGCGRQSPLRLIRSKKFYSVGVDIFKNYIDISRNKGIHDDYIICDIMDIDNHVENKSFDCVILLDVIEHLKKTDAIKLLKKIENIGINKIIITTPNGFLKQEIYHSNIYQIHRSGWNRKFFKKLDFKVYGMRGLKFLRTERGEMRFRSIKPISLIHLISPLFLKYLPLLSFQLLAVKNLKN